MSEELDNFKEQGSKGLPNATAVLVLGILSIVFCAAWGVIGLILGIIAIILHKKDKALYATNPTMYEQSFKNSKAGNICAIIGIILSSLCLIYVIVVFAFVATVASSTIGNSEFQEAFQSITDSINANRH